MKLLNAASTLFACVGFFIAAPGLCNVNKNDPMQTSNTQVETTLDDLKTLKKTTEEKKSALTASFSTYKKSTETEMEHLEKQYHKTKAQLSEAESLLSEHYVSLQERMDDSQVSTTTYAKLEKEKQKILNSMFNIRNQIAKSKSKHTEKISLLNESFDKREAHYKKEKKDLDTMLKKIDANINVRHNNP